jgi:hypothetical protein
MSQKMAIWTAVRRMTGNTSIDTRRSMLEHEGTILCRMAFAATIVARTAESSLSWGTVWVMARRTSQNVFLQTVAFAKAKFREHFFVTADTCL